MLGRRSQIRFRTGFNNSAVDALSDIAEDTLENIDNFTQSPAVKSAVRGTNMAAPMKRMQNAAAELMDAVMAFDNEYFGWLESNDLNEETEELTEMFGRGPKIKPRSGFNDSTTEAFLEVIQEAFENIQNYAGAPAVRASVGGTKMQKHLNAIRQLATKMMDESIKYDNEYLTWKNEDLEFNMTEEIDLEEDLSTPVETVSLTEEAVKDIKKKIQKKFKKGDDIRYIDARDHEERTGKYKGLKYMGGRSYAQVETGKELLALPVFQIVLD